MKAFISSITSSHYNFTSETSVATMAIQRTIVAVFILTFLVIVIQSGCSSGTPKPEPSKQLESKPSDTSSWEGAKIPAGQYTGWENHKGIGPVKELVLGEIIDEQMVEAGAKLYKEKCTTCHKTNKRFIGPAPKDILQRRTPEWVMNMILNPEQMVKEDPIAQQLLKDYNLSPMTNQNLTEAEARNILEYFRTL